MTKVKIHYNYEEFQGDAGVAVVLDIYRASNTILAILGSGAESVIPKTANTNEEVIAVRDKYSGHIFFGEHNGTKFAAADYDNSPSKAAELDLTGQKTIIASSKGSKAIVAASNAEEVIVASFANLDSVVDYLSKKNNVALLCCCDPDGQEALEDNLCARAIYEFMKGDPNNLEAYLTRLKTEGSGTTRLLSTGLQNDLDFCLTSNSTQIIPYVDKSGEEIKVVANKTQDEIN